MDAPDPAMAEIYMMAVSMASRATEEAEKAGLRREGVKLFARHSPWYYWGLFGLLITAFLIFQHVFPVPFKPVYRKLLIFLLTNLITQLTITEI